MNIKDRYTGMEYEPTPVHDWAKSSTPLSSFSQSYGDLLQYALNHPKVKPHLYSLRAGHDIVAALIHLKALSPPRLMLVGSITPIMEAASRTQNTLLSLETQLHLRLSKLSKLDPKPSPSVMVEEVLKEVTTIVSEMMILVTSLSNLNRKGEKIHNI